MSFETCLNDNAADVRPRWLASQVHAERFHRQRSELFEFRIGGGRVVIHDEGPLFLACERPSIVDLTPCGHSAPSEQRARQHAPPRFNASTPESKRPYANFVKIVNHLPSLLRTVLTVNTRIFKSSSKDMFSRYMMSYLRRWRIS